jgi:hypothetical protein
MDDDDDDFEGSEDAVIQERNIRLFRDGAKAEKGKG